MSHNDNNSALIPFGAGLAAGVLGIYALIELFPLVVLGGAGFLVYKGMTATVDKENTICEIGQQKK